MVLGLNQHRSWAREGRVCRQAPDDRLGPILVSLVPASGMEGKKSLLQALGEGSSYRGKKVPIGSGEQLVFPKSVLKQGSLSRQD